MGTQRLSWQVNTPLELGMSWQSASVSHALSGQVSSTIPSQSLSCPSHLTSSQELSKAVGSQEVPVSRCCASGRTCCVHLLQRPSAPQVWVPSLQIPLLRWWSLPVKQGCVVPGRPHGLHCLASSTLSLQSLSIPSQFSTCGVMSPEQGPQSNPSFCCTHVRKPEVQIPLLRVSAGPP